MADTHPHQVSLSNGFSSLLSILMRRWLPVCGTFASVLIAATVYLMLTPRLYETSARLKLDDNKVSISDLGRDLARLPESTPGGSNPIATQAELIKSQRVLKRAATKVSAETGENIDTISAIGGSLRVKIVPATNILEVSSRGKDPKLTAMFLNAVMTSMVEENIEAIRAGARSVRKFLEAEVPKQRAVLERAEATESLYRQENGLVSVADQTTKLVDSLGTVENQERDLIAQLQEVATRNLSLQRVIGTGNLQSAYASVRVGQDEDLKALRTRLIDLETKVIDGRSRLGDQHPDLLALIEQRDEVRTLYTTRLSRIIPGAKSNSPNIAGDALSQDLISRLITSEIERVALQQRLLAVRSARVSLQARLSELPIKQQPLAALTRAREEAEATLKLLQSKLQEASIAEAQLVSNIQIISEAETPEKPEWPKKPAVLVTAIALGLALATGIVLLLELLDDVIYSSTEAEKVLNQPTLGELPALPINTRHLWQPDSFLNQASLVEPYRKLLKTLEFRTSTPLNLLVFSSAVAGEGRSTVVAHLAAVSAILNHQTLIIDTDFHNPQQEQIFNLPHSTGLADVIHHKLSLQAAIQATEVENLSVLVAGEPLLRSSLLLETPEFKVLLTQALEMFDLVILDTPPVNAYSDALTLSQGGDGVVLVVCPGVSSRKELLRASNELHKNGISLIGFVTNSTKSSISNNYFNSGDGDQRFADVLRRVTPPKILQRWSVPQGEKV